MVAPDRTRRLGNRALWLIAIVAVLFAVLVVRGRLNGSTDKASSIAAVELDAFAVTYHILEFDRERTEQVLVHLPYESRRSSEHQLGRTETITDHRGLWQLASDGSDHFVLLEPGRRRADGDVRPLSSVLFLVEEGLAEPRGDDVVAGRTCLEFRVAEPVGSVAVRVPTDTDHVDICLDERTGILLRERWVVASEPLRTQNAVRVDLSPRIDEDAIKPCPATSAASLPQSRHEIPFTSDIADGFEIEFDLPQDVVEDGGTAILDMDPLGQPVGGTAHRFFRRGSAVVDVEEVNGESRNVERGVRTEVPIGEGWIETDLRTITLTVVLPSGTAVLLRSHDLGLIEEVADAIRLGSVGQG